MAEQKYFLIHSYRAESCSSSLSDHESGSAGSAALFYYKPPEHCINITQVSLVTKVTKQEIYLTYWRLGDLQ